MDILPPTNHTHRCHILLFYSGLIVNEMLVRKYVDWNGSTVILATKRSAGVAPEVNLVILLHRQQSMQARGTTLILKPRAEVTRRSKNRVSLAHKRTDILQKNFLKKC